MKTSKKIFFILAALAVGIFSTSSLLIDDEYVRLAHNVELFGRVLREITNTYVDSVNVDNFVHAGIDGMLETLDPYTVYNAPDEHDDLDALTTGQYGGIGASLAVHDGVIVITSLAEGRAAARAGLRIGDEIHEVNGTNVRAIDREQYGDSIRSLVRGEVGRQVTLGMHRPVEERNFTVTLTREEIPVKSLTYSEVLDRNILLLRIERFSRHATEEVRAVLRERREEPLRGVIIDLRNNPGGLLDAATSMLNLFVPKGSFLLSTHGRDPINERKYYAEETPVLPDVPLVVLINTGSASASEIFAGAVQDLDRGVVIGTRSYGKGLVQSTVQLPYGALLKLTTARYYTPSGRSIQEINYEKRREGMGSGISAKKDRRRFTTVKGRGVYELGGILPDTVVQQVLLSAYILELERQHMFFNFATKYVSSMAGLPKEWEAGSALVGEFKTYLTKKKFSYRDSVETALDQIERFTLNLPEKKSSLGSDIAHLRTIVAEYKEESFSRYDEDIKRFLTREILRRYYGDNAAFSVSYKSDEQLAVARSIVASPARYKTRLSMK